MKGRKVVVGVFTYLDDTLKAIESAKQSKLDFRVFAPFYNHEIDVHSSTARSDSSRGTESSPQCH